MQVVSVNAQKMMEKPWWHFWSPRRATQKGHRRYTTGGTNRTTYENFKSMKLLKKSRAVDEQGRWWVIETRQDIATGLIIKRRERITD